MWTLQNSSKTLTAGLFPSKAAAEQFTQRLTNRGILMEPIELLVPPEVNHYVEQLNLWTWTEGLNQDWLEGNPLPRLLM